MESANSPADDLAKQVEQVSEGVRLSLTRHLSKMPALPVLSPKTRAQIKKRVPPKTLNRYFSPDNAIGLLALEISDLGTRIHHYRYIERYREYFTAPNAAIRVAFVNHTHILRGSEIYVIMERSSSCLAFFFDLAADLDLGPKQMSGTLERQFKKEFERHLRERHRIVHAHERPSMISRLIGVAPEAVNHPDVQQTHADAIARLSSMLTDRLGPEFQGKDFEQTIKLINDFRLKAVDEECLKMWAIFLDSLNKLIDSEKLLK